MTLTRGDRPLEKREQLGLAPAGVPDYLRETVADLVQPHLGRMPPRADRQAEARQLADRAQQALRVGDWAEALALTEAALLLDPHREEWHHDAVVALGWLTRRHWQHKPATVEEAAPAVNYHRRGLEHLEAFLSTAGDLRPYVTSGGSDFIGRFMGTSPVFHVAGDCPAEVREFVADARRQQREVLLRLVRLRAKAGRGDEMTVEGARTPGARLEQR